MNTSALHIRRAHSSPHARSHSRIVRALPIRLPALAIPDRIVLILSMAAGALVVVYVVLMVTTIFFAAWQTQLAKNVEGSRVAISGLEDQYYAAMARINSTDPSSMGLVAPHTVEYVVAARAPGLTFAGR